MWRLDPKSAGMGFLLGMLGALAYALMRRFLG